MSAAVLPDDAPALSRRARWTSLILCGAVMLLDGYDLTAMPLAVPHLVQAYGHAPETFGLALSAVLLGLGLGAVGLAPLGDRFGRRRVILIAIPVLALATFGTATGQSVEAFTAWRLLTGLALGACLPNVTALSAELALPGRRASTMTIVSMAIPLGAAGSGLVVSPLVAAFGWQAIFILPGLVTLLLLGLLWMALSECPAVAGDVEERAGSGAPLVQLLRRPIFYTTALICVLYGVNAAALYYINSWVPTILPEAGFTLETAAHAVSLLQFGGMVIGLLLARMLDGGRVTVVLATSYGAIALALLAFGIVPPTRLGWGILLLIAGGGISGVHVAILAVASGLVPARLLSSLIGLAVAVARIGAIGGPLLGAAVVEGNVGVALFFAFAALPVALCLGLTILLPVVRRAARPPAQSSESEKSPSPRQAVSIGR